MRSPLVESLVKSQDSQQAYTELKPTEWSDFSPTNPKFQSECKELTKLGVPIGLSVATQLLQYFTDQSMVGHLGTDYLAAASLAGVLMAMSSTYIFAFCDTINVLCSQALGAKNMSGVAEWMQLGCILAAILSIPSFITFYFAEQIFLAFGASDHIAKLSGEFARWSMLSLLPNTQFMATRMYFKAQSNVLPAMYICTSMVLFNIVANFILVYGYGANWIVYKLHGTHWNGLGFIGSPIATACTATVQYIAYVVYMFGWKKYHITSGTWSPIRCSRLFTWKRIKSFMAVGIPTTISYALEEWQIQIIALFAASLQEADLAAFSSSITVTLVCHTMSMGLSDAVTVRVANFLGANDPSYAKYISYVAIIMAFSVGLVVAVLLATVGKYLAYVVSGTHEIYVIFEHVFPIVGSSLFLLSALTVVAGILVGQARTSGLAVVALISCWGLSVPLSYMIGIHWHYGIVGIWVGIIIGYSMFAFSVFALFARTKWQQCALDAVNRNAQECQGKIKFETEDESLAALPSTAADSKVHEAQHSLMSDDFSVNHKQED